MFNKEFASSLVKFPSTCTILPYSLRDVWILKIRSIASVGLSRSSAVNIISFGAFWGRFNVDNLWELRAGNQTAQSILQCFNISLLP